jgi:hypothetical protein
MFLEVQATRNFGKGKLDMVDNRQTIEDDDKEDLEPFDPTKKYLTAEAHDEEDVPNAIDSETQDGKGGAVVPKANFVSYAAAEDDA